MHTTSWCGCQGTSHHADKCRCLTEPGVIHQSDWPTNGLSRILQPKMKAENQPREKHPCEAIPSFPYHEEGYFRAKTLAYSDSSPTDNCFHVLIPIGLKKDRVIPSIRS